MNKREWLFLISIVLFLITFPVAFVSDAHAEYPDKTIEFVNWAKAGGSADVLFRTVAHTLNSEGIVKPRIQIVNREGSGSVAAINYVISKKGDPHFIMQWTTSPLVAVLRGTTLVKNPLDMTILCSLTEDTNMLIVRTDSKYKTLADLVEDARKNPGKVKLAIGNIGGSEHVVGNRLEKTAGVKFNMTSFPGGSTITTLGGHVDFGIGPLEQTRESLKAKKLRALASVGEKRSEFMPDIPTMKEQGVNAAFTQLRGFWGPPEMPDYAVRFWEKAFARVMETKAFKDYLIAADMDRAYMGAEEAQKFLIRYSKELASDLSELDVYGSKKN